MLGCAELAYSTVYTLIELGRTKKICVFQVTWNFKIGMVGRIVFILFKIFMGIIGKQYVRMGKSHRIL